MSMNERQQRTAIVTYARNRIALVICRSLAHRGVRVITADSIRPAMTSFSRYSSGHFVYPSPMQRPADFVAHLASKAREHGASLVIPSHEETFVLAQHRRALEEQGISVPVTDYDTILKAHDKAQSGPMARDLGIPTPRTWHPATAEEVSAIAREAEFPLVIKLRKGRGSIGLAYVRSAAELETVFRTTVAEFGLGPGRYPLVQQWIDGNGVGVSMLYDRGQPRATFTHLRLREYPTTGGTSVERISIRCPEAEECARRLLSHLNWHGVAMVEFRIDRRSQKPYFLEINPRFWGSLNQAVQSGVDFPHLLYQIAIGQQIEPVLDYRLGVRTVWIYGYLRALIDALGTAGRWRALGDLLHPRRVHFDDFWCRDPLPFAVEPLFALKQLVTRGKLTFETDDEAVENTRF